ncbi:MAG: hypothetical protein ABSD72_11910, partial [Terracidiphilus sp.]
DGQGPYVRVQGFGYLARRGFGGKQSVFVDQHGCNFALSRRSVEVDPVVVRPQYTHLASKRLSAPKNFSGTDEGLQC